MPKVLIADELSPRALEIFRERGVEVDVNTGLKKPELLKIIEAKAKGKRPTIKKLKPHKTKNDDLYDQLMQSLNTKKGA